MDRLWKNGPHFAQSEHFKVSTDSVLLGDFVNIGSRARGIDLGCGSGLLPLLLLWRSERLHMTGLEIDPEAAATARRNIESNALSQRCDVVTGDIKNCRELFKSGEFELVVSNPPYFSAGSGGVPSDEKRAAARGEVLCSLEDVCRAAAYLCRTGGVFCLVHRAERLADVVCTLRGVGFEPKRLRTVSHSAGKDPALILVEARRGGAPGMRIMPPLFIRGDDGGETAEILRIYHREAEA